jgi:hypothetical protein
MAVILNEVKDLLLLLPMHLNPTDKFKSRFFVAEFILSMAEGLLRMTQFCSPDL